MPFARAAAAASRVQVLNCRVLRSLNPEVTGLSRRKLVISAGAIKVDFDDAIHHEVARSLTCSRRPTFDVAQRSLQKLLLPISIDVRQGYQTGMQLDLPTQTHEITHVAGDDDAIFGNA